MLAAAREACVLAALIDAPANIAAAMTLATAHTDNTLRLIASSQSRVRNPGRLRAVGPILATRTGVAQAGTVAAKVAGDAEPLEARGDGFRPIGRASRLKV